MIQVSNPVHLAVLKSNSKTIVQGRALINLIDCVLQLFLLVLYYFLILIIENSMMKGNFG
jgi:uncharacterized protein YqhQ